MKPLLKGLIITIVTVSVVVPAGYYAFTSFDQSSVSLAQVVPGNSSLVMSGTYNGTPAYLYNSSGGGGLILGVDLSGFSTQLSSASNSTNSTNGTHPAFQPSLYATYRGYNVYQVKNVSLEGLIPQNITDLTAQYNLTLNTTAYIQNDTIYVADFTNVVSLGSYSSVTMTIDTLLDKTGFQSFSQMYFNSTANVSVYYNYNSPSAILKQGVVNVFYQSTTFNLEFNSSDTATNVSRALSGLNAIATNYTYFYLSPSKDAWVNGTMAVGVGNYYMLQYLLDTVAGYLSQYNYTQLLSGQIP